MDGSERLALGAAIAFLGLNGRRLTSTVDEAYGLIVAVADGAPDDVPAIVERLARGTRRR